VNPSIVSTPLPRYSSGDPRRCKKTRRARTMWPDLLGPGWGWGLLLSCSFFAALIGAGTFLAYRARRCDDDDEPFQTLWRRYEQGDLTREEFERLKPARAMLQPPRPHQRIR